MLCWCFMCTGVFLVSGSVCSFFFFFKQKTAYEMRISDWSSDVCSSDLCDDLRLDLGGAFEDVEDARVAEHAGDLVLLGVAVAAVHLQRVVGVGPGDARAQQFRHAGLDEIGRASCRERVCQYWEISVVAVSLKKKTIKQNINVKKN